MDEVRATALVSGRVQGVGFRYWVREQAFARGLAGSATNLQDGRVEVIAEGPREACQALLDALDGDRTPGVVGDVSVSWGSAEGLDGFRTG